MNYVIFLGILNLILLSRLRLMLRDDGISRKDMIVLGAIPLLSLLFLQINVSWFLLLIYLLAYPPLMFLSEKSTDNLNRNRGLFLLLHLVVIGLLCSPLFNLSANSFSGRLVHFFSEILMPRAMISSSGILSAQLFIFGLLSALNEANIILRYLFSILGLDKLGAQGEEVDQEEFNTGRIIGLLERIFVFLFVLLNQYTAIGFILAAKGVARFQDFKSRTFAEYVLIGTLLSALLAMIVAFAVKTLLVI